MQCRGCLLMNCKNTTKLDENYILCFNSITDLNMCEGDNMPQQLCEKCFSDLEFCIAFRNKCISSNSILYLKSKCASEYKDKLNLNHIKEEDISNDDSMEYEDINIKQEEIDEVKEYKSDSDENIAFENTGDVKITYEKNVVKRQPNLRKRKVVHNKKEKLTKKNIDQKKRKETCYNCGLCTGKLEKKELLVHINSHEKNNSCDICSENFTEWQKLLVHRIKHLSKENLLCHICFKHFKLPTSLELHYNIKHFSKDEETYLKCLACNKTYRDVRCLQKHQQASHSSRTYTCDDCLQEFTNKKVLTYHILTRHQQGERKKLLCDQCDYSSSFLSNLKQHKIRRHTSERVYCKVCKEVFANESKLSTHKCSRKGSMCPICGVVLNIHARLNRHLQSHSTDRLYKCDRCPETYRSKAALERHINRHDGVKTNHCEFCPAKFYEPSALIKHRRVHTGEKPYVCKICHKGFTGNHNLKVHMRVHGENLIKKKSDNLTEELPRKS